LLEVLEPGRVLVITATGDSFSGEDVPLPRVNQGWFLHELELRSKLQRKLLQQPLPVIVAAHGDIRGAGLLLVAAASLVLATIDSCFSFPKQHQECTIILSSSTTDQIYVCLSCHGQGSLSKPSDTVSRGLPGAGPASTAREGLTHEHRDGATMSDDETQVVLPSSMSVNNDAGADRDFHTPVTLGADSRQATPREGLPADMRQGSSGGSSGTPKANDGPSNSGAGSSSTGLASGAGGSGWGLSGYGSCYDPPAQPSATAPEGGSTDKINAVVDPNGTVLHLTDSMLLRLKDLTGKSPSHRKASDRLKSWAARNQIRMAAARAGEPLTGTNRDGSPSTRAETVSWAEGLTAVDDELEPRMLLQELAVCGNISPDNLCMRRMGVIINYLKLPANSILIKEAVTGVTFLIECRSDTAGGFKLYNQGYFRRHPEGKKVWVHGLRAHVLVGVEPLLVTAWEDSRCFVKGMLIKGGRYGGTIVPTRVSETEGPCHYHARPNGETDTRNIHTHTHIHTYTHTHIHTYTHTHIHTYTHTHIHTYTH
jgi:hypothetical protein